ncbi:MAG: SDR family oxidoreductase [Thermoplasmata archaeon]|nr:SDR family oxidoreductase [Thermoplasmata archaeon]
MSEPGSVAPRGLREDFHGKVACVIGASKGIGADTARLFALRGASVILASRELAGLNQVADDIRRAGGEALVVPVDLGDESAVIGLGREIAARFDRLDFAFNNAGEGCPPTSLADVTTAAFDRVFGVTVRGTFLAMKQEIPLMVKSGGGSIVNMSSTAGSSAFRGGGPYVAAKHAIEGITKAAALDYGIQKVRVNAVAPGPIDTHRLKAAPEPYRERARQAVPLGRLGNGTEVGEAVVWLCSDAASFVTGTTLAVDGGRLAGWA